jgi:uncharacterized protein (DUF2252 family)
MLRNGGTTRTNGGALAHRAVPHGHHAHRHLYHAVQKAKPYRAKPSIGGTELVPVNDLLAAGKALRDRVPRTAHAGLHKHAHRADPVHVLHLGDAGRLRELIPIRYGRMLASPFTFYRGSAAIMAADLAQMPATGIRVQACGDCHLLNFGGFATPERSIIFDINDFDETLPGPWEWDVKRLVASLVLASRSNGFTEAQAKDTAITAARSYRKTMREFTAMHPLEVWNARITASEFIKILPKSQRAAVQAKFETALSRAGSEMDFPKLTCMVGGHIGIHDAPPLIFHPESTNLPEFWKFLDKVFAGYRETLSDDRRGLLDQYRIVDAAIKVVGIGSVGRRCWIALLMSATNEPLFLQFKEAVPSVLEPYAGKSVYAHQGQRVVAGQRMMQPSSDALLGWVTATSGHEERQFYVRRLNDAKIKPHIETFGPGMLSVYAKACGRVLARAHAKAGDQFAISGYLGTSDQFDEAMGKFAVAYADQAEKDYATLKAAVKSGKIKVYQE